MLASYKSPMLIIADTKHPVIEARIRKRFEETLDIRYVSKAIPAAASVIGALEDLGLSNDADRAFSCLELYTLSELGHAINGLLNGATYNLFINWGEFLSSFDQNSATFPNVQTSAGPCEVRLRLRKPGDEPDIAVMRQKAEAFFEGRPQELMDVSISKRNDADQNHLTISFANTNGQAVTGIKAGTPLEAWELLPDEVILNRHDQFMMDADRERHYYLFAQKVLKTIDFGQSPPPEVLCSMRSESQLDIKIQTFNKDGTKVIVTLASERFADPSNGPKNRTNLLERSRQEPRLEKRIRSVCQRHEEGYRFSQIAVEDLPIHEHVARFMLKYMGKRLLLATLKDLINKRNEKDDVLQQLNTTETEITAADIKFEISISKRGIRAFFVLDEAAKIRWLGSSVRFDNGYAVPAAIVNTLPGQPLGNFISFTGAETVKIRKVHLIRSQKRSGHIRSIEVARPATTLRQVIAAIEAEAPATPAKA